MRGGNAEKDDTNAAMIEHFDPVTMTLPEIEAKQATVAELAAWHRREEEGKPEDDPLTDFVTKPPDKDWAPSATACTSTAPATRWSNWNRSTRRRTGGERSKVTD